MCTVKKTCREPEIYKKLFSNNSSLIYIIQLLFLIKNHYFPAFYMLKDKDLAKLRDSFSVLNSYWQGLCSVLLFSNQMNMWQSFSVSVHCFYNLTSTCYLKAQIHVANSLLEVHFQLPSFPTVVTNCMGINKCISQAFLRWKDCSFAKRHWLHSSDAFPSSKLIKLW